MAMIAPRLARRGAALAASAAAMQARGPSASVRHDIGRTGGLGLLYRDFDVLNARVSRALHVALCCICLLYTSPSPRD